MLDYIKSKHNINDIDADSEELDGDNIIEKNFSSNDQIIEAISYIESSLDNE